MKETPPKNPLSPEWSRVASIAALFVIAVVFLFLRIDRELDPDIGKDWWTVAFEERDPASTVFTVTNHSRETDFSYVVSHAGMEISSGTVTVPRGSEGTVVPDLSAVAGRTTVSVSTKDGRKLEIYRER